MIYCVWYPSGGFGHFVNSVLNTYGKNFVRPSNSITFSTDGNSHGVEYVAPKYFKNQQTYQYNFDKEKNYSIVIDNGINDEGTGFAKFFPGATIIKLCYSDFTWPVVALTMIKKAMRSDIDREIPVDSDKWSGDQDWCKREKYFLFLRDNNLRSAWRPDKEFTSILIEDLMLYESMHNHIVSAGVELDPCQNIHVQWLNANQKYFDPILVADQYVNRDIDYQITDLWTQAVIYYQIWCKYGVEVPHNQFANFFESQEQFRNWIKAYQ